jgi:hypothetical protein
VTEGLNSHKSLDKFVIDEVSRRSGKKCQYPIPGPLKHSC